MDGIRLLELGCGIRSGGAGDYGVTAISRHFHSARKPSAAELMDYITQAPSKRTSYFWVLDGPLQHRRLIIEKPQLPGATWSSSSKRRTAQAHRQARGTRAVFTDDTFRGPRKAPWDLKDAETEGHCQRRHGVFCIYPSPQRSMPVPDPYHSPPINMAPDRAAFLLPRTSARWLFPTSILRKPGPLDDAEKERKCASIAEIGYKHASFESLFLRDCRRNRACLTRNFMTARATLADSKAEPDSSRGAHLLPSRIRSDAMISGPPLPPSLAHVPRPRRDQTLASGSQFDPRRCRRVL